MVSKRQKLYLFEKTQNKIQKKYKLSDSSFKNKDNFFCQCLILKLTKIELVNNRYDKNRITIVSGIKGRPLMK